MKKLTNQQKIISAILAILILAGVIITCTVGLNFGLEYSESKRIEITIGKEFDKEEIKQLAKEVLGDHTSVKVEKVEFFEDVVAITVKDITEEQLESLNNKINEKYDLQQTVEALKVNKMPHVRGRDLIKPYILPMSIATVLILIYMAIRFFKLGIGKVLLQTVLTTVIAEVVLLALIAITRVPLNQFTIPAGLIVYVATLAYIAGSLEKKLRNKALEEEK